MPKLEIYLNDKSFSDLTKMWALESVPMTMSKFAAETIKAMLYPIPKTEVNKIKKLKKKHIKKNRK